jgi:hypothetical protein
MAPGSGTSPWAAEPAAGPESVAFACEFLLAVTDNPSVGLRAASHDTLDSLRMALLELSLHQGRCACCGEISSLNLTDLAARPWSMLDYALGRLTGFLVVSYYLHSGRPDPARTVITHLIKPEAMTQWGLRFNALAAASALLPSEAYAPVPIGKTAPGG